MTDLYARQEELLLDIPPEVTVVGCGGIGSWVAIFAAMTGIRTIYLFDPDVMEESNRNRLPFCQSSINRPKVEIVADFIRAIRTDCLVVAIQGKMDEMLLGIQMNATDTGCIIDCTDSPKTQIMLYNTCKKYGHGYIRAGYDGTRIMITNTVSGWIKKDVEEEPYQVNPSWVVPAVTVAALTVSKLCKYPNQEVGLDIGEIGIPVLQRQKRVTARCYQQPGEERRR
jgi:molybdopterin/thiamine biosynthesis adenylyltransferase